MLERMRPRGRSDRSAGILPAGPFFASFFAA
jgi:hypothetical protein